MTQTIFVYGTLLQGEQEHDLLAGTERIAEQSYADAALWDTGKGYPAAVASADSHRVYGELYRVNNEVFARVETLAQARGLERCETEVRTDRETVQATAFFLPQDGVETSFEKVALGDWKCHTRLGELPLLYFAYASCLDTERFQLAGVDRQFEDVAGLGVLKGYSLRFTYLAGDGAGRADVVEEGGVVEGKVYRIGREALDYLWGREGVESEEYRPAMITVEMNGERHEALTFLVVHKAPADIAPPAHYVKEILRGAQGFVSPAYYQQLQNVIGSFE